MTVSLASLRSEAVLAGLEAAPAADVGAALAPATAKWLGGVPGEQENELEQRLGETVSIMRFVPSYLHADIRAGGTGADLTPYFQAAIDQLTSDVYQSTIIVPSGVYFVNQIIAKSGVAFYHPVIAGRPHDQGRPRIQFVAGSSAPSMFYSAGVVSGFGLHGLFLGGRGNAVDHSCIDIAELQSFGLTGLIITGFGRQAINLPIGVMGRIADCFVLNSGAVPKTNQLGCVDIGGTEIYIQDCELGGGVGTGGSGTKVSDTGDKNCCLVIRGSGNWLRDLICEFGEVGIVLTGSGQAHNHLANVIADNCVGHGFIVNSTRNTLTGCRSHRCGHDANDTYSGFEVLGPSNTLVGCNVTGTGDLNQVKYGFNDNGSGAFDLLANMFTGCVSHEHRTRGFNNVHGERRAAFQMPFTHGVQSTVTGAAQNVSLDQIGFVVLDAASAASVAAFTNGVKGQRCLIGFTNSNVTITHNSSTLVCPGGTNIAGTVDKLYEAVKMTTTKWKLREHA